MSQGTAGVHSVPDEAKRDMLSLKAEPLKQHI